jgi:signal transduction histidine kinase
MDNRIQSGLKSTASIRMGSGAACNSFYGRPPDAKEFPSDLPRAQEESVQVQNECRAFAMAANAIREEEKARLARELHDELAQSLTVLKMDAIWVRDNAACGLEAVAAKLTEMVTLLDRTVAATRRMATDLRPMLLDDLGLGPAIEWLANSFTERCGVVCRVSVDEKLEFELQEPYSTAVFRIIQESLANVAKHAEASQVSVILAKVPNALILSVKDNGCGFFPAAARKSQSLGLLGLRERAQLLGGSVVIKSAPGYGTNIEVCIPLQHSGTVL